MRPSKCSGNRPSQPIVHRPRRGVTLRLWTASVGLLACFAQAAAAPGDADQVVNLSPFEVTTTQGRGYVSTNAATGLKTDEALLNIPQEVTVVTRDMIDDLYYEDSADLLQFFGLSTGNGSAASESLGLRGYPIARPYVDDMPEGQAYEDSGYIDSFEIIKGPAEVLYGNATLSGIVLKATRKPLPYEQNVVTASVDQWGLFRATFDTTGPVGTLAGTKIAYRLYGAEQAGGTYFTNTKDDRQVLFPVLQATFAHTTVRWNFAYQNIYHTANGNSLITPYGALYTGAGTREGYYLRDTAEHHQSKNSEIYIEEKVSENWAMKFAGDVWTYHRFGGVAIPTGYNWTNMTYSMFARLNNQTTRYWSMIGDANGHYHLGIFKNMDAFGFADYDQVNISKFWTTAQPTFGTNNSLNLPMASTIVDSLVAPQWQQYSVPANPGQYTETYYSDIYYQHEIDVIPDRLLLIGGITWANISTDSVANMGIIPYQATKVSEEQWLHRFGAVFKLTPDLSLYALNSTSFTPGGTTLLLNGQLSPPQEGKGDEVGVKTAFLGGRISTSFAFFKMVTTNITRVGGQLPNGQSYVVPIGTTTQKGVDGDIAINVLKGWQVIASFYNGTDRDENGIPVSTSYDNSWSIFNRYDFARGSPLGGWSLGGGLVRIGGRWLADSGVTAAPGVLPANGEIKLETGTLVNGFLNYRLNRHWQFRLSCDNILNQFYVLGAQALYEGNPSPPRTFLFLTTFKF